LCGGGNRTTRKVEAIIVIPTLKASARGVAVTALARTGRGCGRRGRDAYVLHCVVGIIPLKTTQIVGIYTPGVLF